MRWRSKEYKEAYPNLVGKSNTGTYGGKVIGEVTVKSANPVEKAARKAANYVARETFATALNTYDMPRRIVASITNPDYTFMEAINPVGTQEYHSVTSDKFAAEHPYIAAAADISTGLAAMNAGSIVKSGVRATRGAIRAAEAANNTAEQVAKLNAMPYAKRIAAVKAINKGVPKGGTKVALSQDVRPTINGIKNEKLLLPKAGTKGGTSTSNFIGVGKVRGKTGTRSQGSSKWLSKSNPINGGKVRGGGYKVGTSVPALEVVVPPAAVPFRPGFVPIPGLPGGILPLTPTPTLIPKARIETSTPTQLSLSEILNTVNEGDTIITPNGEYIRKNTTPSSNWKERYFDIQENRTYDAADVADEQYIIPAKSNDVWTAGQTSVGKYYPRVPSTFKRGTQTYPQVITKKAVYKPLQ
jgi:hypothetical protein